MSAPRTASTCTISGPANANAAATQHTITDTAAIFQPSSLDTSMPSVTEGFQSAATQAVVSMAEKYKLARQYEEAIASWREKYNAAQVQYQTLLDEKLKQVAAMQQRTSSTNTYLNKLIGFRDPATTDGTTIKARVTNMGVVKRVGEGNSLGNGTPFNASFSNPLPDWVSEYNTIGANVPLKDASGTTIPLKMGSPLEAGQVMGSEGQHVFVNRLVNPSQAAASTYQRCVSGGSNTVEEVGENVTFDACRRMAYQLSKPFFAWVRDASGNAGKCRVASSIGATDVSGCVVVDASANIRTSPATNTGNVFAWYRIGASPYDHVGKLGYVDEDSTMHTYAANNMQYLGIYDQLFTDVDVSGQTIMEYDSLTKEACQSRCSADERCAGFVLKGSGAGSTTGKCVLKHQKAFVGDQRATRTYLRNANTYLRRARPRDIPAGTPSVGSNGTTNVVTFGSNAFAAHKKDNTPLTGDSKAFEIKFAKQADLDRADQEMRLAAEKINGYETKLDALGLSKTSAVNKQSREFTAGHQQVFDALHDKMHRWQDEYSSRVEDSEINLGSSQTQLVVWSGVAVGAFLLGVQMLQS